MDKNHVLSLLILFVFIPKLSFGELPCGEARIISGASCKTLRVEFNLSRCGGKPKGLASVICDDNQARAQWQLEDHLYVIPLRELSAGVWAPVGSVRQYPKSWNPDLGKNAHIKFRVSPVPSKPEEWPSVFELGGHFRFRAEENRKNDFLSERGFSSLRLRLGFLLRPHESTSFFLEPQANHIFGNLLLQPATASVNAPVATSGVNQDPILGFHQAFAEFRGTPQWRFLVGRQMLAYGDEVLVGASDWDNPGRSFDGIRSRFEWGLSWWDLFSTKLWESQSQTNGAGDRDFHGTYISWTHPNQEIELQPYFFWLRDHRSSFQQLFTTGIHTRFRLVELELKGEMAGQWGQSAGQQAWIQLQSKRFTSWSFQISADGFWASQEFNPLFPSVHTWLGWADIFGRRNLSGLGGNWTFQIPQGPEFNLRVLHFLRTHTSAPVYGADGSTLIQQVSSGKQSLGTEWDIICQFNWLATVDVQAAASLFFPSEELKSVTLNRDWLGRLELSIATRF